MLKPQFNHNDVEIIETHIRYKGFFQILEIIVKHRLFAGGSTPAFSRELFARGHAVGVLLYDEKRDVVVLTEQFRVGALDEPQSPWLFELVAGMIEDGEDAETVARREAIEEAGCEIQRLEKICEYLSSPGGTSETVTLYCGHVDSEGVGGIHGLQDEHEDIRVHVVSSAEAIAMMRDGHINNAAAIIALQWLALSKSD